MATNVDGIVTYRHPLIRDAAGTRGKIIRKGVGRLSLDEQERVMAELSQLLKAGGSSPSAPFVGGIGQEAFRIFWEPVFGEKWLDQYREYAKQDRNLSERAYIDDRCAKKYPIMIWYFDDAPKELQLSQGGDEDFIIAFPPGLGNLASIDYKMGYSFADIPYQLMNLGCCDNAIFRVLDDGKVEKRDENDCELWNQTSFLCPSYIGWHILIPCHA